MSDVPESVTLRGVREVLRTFAESRWTSMTLEIDGMRISVGRNGPPTTVSAEDGLRPPDSQPTAEHRQSTALEPTAETGSPGQPERTVHSRAEGAPGFNATGGGRQFSASTVQGPADSPGESERKDRSLAGGPPVSTLPVTTDSSATSTTGTDVDLDGCVAVRSPAVGAFWVAPSPGQPPFVQVGQTVAADEQVAIVEVMKLMNPVVAGVAGEVVQVCAANADLVEYDQVLFWIRRSDA